MQAQPHAALQPARPAINMRKKLPLNPEQNQIDGQGHERNEQNDQVDVLAKLPPLKRVDLKAQPADVARILRSIRPA